MSSNRIWPTGHSDMRFLSSQPQSEGLPDHIWSRYQPRGGDWWDNRLILPLFCPVGHEVGYCNFDLFVVLRCNNFEPIAGSKLKAPLGGGGEVTPITPVPMYPGGNGNRS